MGTGYACPVCDTPQADAEHLANHLAITAALGRENHLEWLEEYAPDWTDYGPEELGEVVSEYALEIETPDVTGEHDHGRERGRPAVDVETALARQSRQPGRGSMRGETERVLEDARALTREMCEREEKQEQEREQEEEREREEGATPSPPESGARDQDDRD